MIKKPRPDIVIEKLGTHLMKVTNNHTGTSTLRWNWDALLDEVRAATNIVIVTEAKVAKTRKPRAKKVKNETNS